MEPPLGFEISNKVTKEIRSNIRSDVSVHRYKKCGNVCKVNTVGEILRKFFVFSYIIT